MTKDPESPAPTVDPALPWRRGGVRTAVAVAVACVLAGSAVFIGTRLGPSHAVRDGADAATVGWTPVELRAPVAVTPLRGHIRTGQVQPVMATLPTGARSLVVTAMRVRPGQVVRPGDVLAVVSGRPVIMVTSPFPFYRDLHVGDRGPDVRALQAVLRGSGAATTAPDGAFGAGTQDALGRFYAHRGLNAPRGSAEQLDAQDRAAASLAGLRPTATPAEVADAQESLARARGAAGPWMPMGELVTIAGESARVSAPARRGAVVQDGAPLLRLSTGHASATARADALATADYRVGTKVRVAVIGIDAAFTGTVAGIGPFVEGTDTASDFPGRDVNVTFAHSPTVPHGTAATIQPVATVGARQPAVPLIALHEDSRGAYVLRKVAGASDGPRPERVPVRVVGQADGFALVVSPGLRAGQFVQLGA